MDKMWITMWILWILWISVNIVDKCERVGIMWIMWISRRGMESVESVWISVFILIMRLFFRASSYLEDVGNKNYKVSNYVLAII